MNADRQDLNDDTDSQAKASHRTEKLGSMNNDEMNFNLEDDDFDDIEERNR